MKRIAHAIEYFVALLATIILGVLTLLMSYERNAVDVQTYRGMIRLVRRFIPLSLLISIVVCWLWGLICGWQCTRPHKMIRAHWQMIPVLSALVTGTECAVWNLHYPYPPISDQWHVWWTAMHIAYGNPYTLEDPTYYMCYPNQKCMAVAMSFIVRVLGNDPATSFRVVNIAAAAIIAGALCVLCYQIFHRRSVMAVCAVLIALFVPHVLYSSFVYGTQIALACVLMAFVCCLQYIHTDCHWWLLPLIVLLPLAYLFYMASMIAFIAIGIIIMLHMPNQRWAQRFVGLLFLICILAACITVRTSAIHRFDSITGLSDTEGMSATAWVAMGITSESEIAVGQFNDIGENRYYEYGPELERELSRRDLRKAVHEYLGGERSLIFFVRKTIGQWCDPWFASSVDTIYLWNDSLEVPDAWREFMQSDVMRGVEIWLTIFSTTCYLAAFLALCKWIYRRMINEGHVLLLLYFIGGFIFHLAWEGNARYCYSYYMMLIPLFAYTVVSAADMIRSRAKAQHAVNDVCADNRLG